MYSLKRLSEHTDVVLIQSVLGAVFLKWVCACTCVCTYFSGFCIERVHFYEWGGTQQRELRNRARLLELPAVVSPLLCVLRTELRFSACTLVCFEPHSPIHGLVSHVYVSQPLHIPLHQFFRSPEQLLSKVSFLPHCGLWTTMHKMDKITQLTVLFSFFFLSYSLCPLIVERFCLVLVVVVVVIMVWGNVACLAKINS